jgi:hypothetical protein
MNQTVGIVIGLLALGVVLAIPFTILWLVGRANQRALAAIAEWATSKGLAKTEASASATVHPSVPSLSFARGRDLVSFAPNVGSAKRGSFTIYVRPHAARLPALALQRNMWGGGGEALGDPGLDEHYRLLHGGADALGLLCSPQVHALLMRNPGQVVNLHVHEGVLILSYEVGEAIDPDAWDRAWALVEGMVAASEHSQQTRRA